MDCKNKIYYLLYLGYADNDNTYGKLHVVPEPGKVLIFQHNLFHEGSLLISGCKYAMRTDIMYTYPPNIAPKEPYPPIIAPNVIKPKKTCLLM